MLYVAGDPERLVPGLAVVGARRATPYGLRMRAAASPAGRRGEGVTIVSGAACGCDQAAQRAAVEAGGSSVAVLGCGADVDYPRSSRELLAHLRAARRGRLGAAVGHAARCAGPSRARNRIIAGLSAAVLVVEAGLPSGTFSTADHALDAGREVLAVPGSVFAPECRGSNRLITAGRDAGHRRTSRTSRGELRACGLLRTRPARAIAGRRHAERPLACARSSPTRCARTTSPARFDSTSSTSLRRIAALEAAGLVARYPDGRYGPANGA